MQHILPLHSDCHAIFCRETRSVLNELASRLSESNVFFSNHFSPTGATVETVKVLSSENELWLWGKKPIKCST